MTNCWTANHCSESDFKSESLNFTTGYTSFILLGIVWSVVILLLYICRLKNIN